MRVWAGEGGGSHAAYSSQTLRNILINGLKVINTFHVVYRTNVQPVLRMATPWPIHDGAIIYGGNEG